MLMIVMIVKTNSGIKELVLLFVQMDTMVTLTIKDVKLVLIHVKNVLIILGIVLIVLKVTSYSALMIIKFVFPHVQMVNMNLLKIDNVKLVTLPVKLVMLVLVLKLVNVPFVTLMLIAQMTKLVLYISEDVYINKLSVMVIPSSELVTKTVKAVKLTLS
jgi:hypothetical protein